MRIPCRLILSALALAAGASQASATTLPYKSFDRLANEADGVVVGTVRAVQPMKDGRSDIHTFVTLDQLQVVGGRYAAPTLTLRLAGGVMGQERLQVEGAPELREGERVLMFVQGNGRDLVPFVGWGQGLFRLVPDGQGDYTVADADGHAVLGVEGGTVRTDAATGPEEVRLAGMPDAVMAMQRAKVGQGGAGRSDDGSESRLVAVKPAGARPMSAQAFIALARQKSAAHFATAHPLRSVAVGQMPAKVDDRDAASRDAAANAAVRPVTDAGQPALPQRAEQPRAATQE